MQIEIIDNSGLVRKDLEAACLRALEKCGLTAEEQSPAVPFMLGNEMLYDEYMTVAA